MRNLILLMGVLLGAAAVAGPVDVNRADAETIARELNGVGLAKARAIVAYRERNGEFQSAEDLLNVKGIGAQILDVNRPNIRVVSESD